VSARRGVFLALALVFTACVPRTHIASPSASPSARAGASAAADIEGAESVPSLDALAARGPSDMPLMREVARAPEAAARPVEIRATQRDICIRAAFATSRPARVWIEDGSRAPRGEITPATTAGLAPPRGPACALKGETLRLVVEANGEPIVARAVVFEAP
jgi:hypothetical protein